MAETVVLLHVEAEVRWDLMAGGGGLLPLELWNLLKSEQDNGILLRGAGSSKASFIRDGKISHWWVGITYIFVVTQNIMEMAGKNKLPAQLQWMESGTVQKGQGKSTELLHQGAGWGLCFLMHHLVLECNWSFPTFWFPRKCAVIKVGLKCCRTVWTRSSLNCAASEESWGSLERKPAYLFLLAGWMPLFCFRSFSFSFAMEMLLIQLSNIWSAY